MCGIAGIYLRDLDLKVDLDSMLDTMLDEIEHRGGDATGFIALGDEGVTEWHRAACDVPDFKKYRRPVPTGTRTILAHTRYATQGLPAFIENNHPIRRGSFYVIHNGHVSNDQELFKLAGRKPYGQVDSEAIPARLASLGKLTDADVVMEEIEGAAAIAAVDETNPGELLLAKGHSSPLYVLVTNKIVVWGSTQTTVEKGYKKHVGRLPKKRKIEYLPTGVMIHFDAKGKQTRTEFECFKPAYEVWTPSPAWKETTYPGRLGLALDEGESCGVPATRHLPTVGSWPKWDDLPGVENDSSKIDCDMCGDSFEWQYMEFLEDDKESDFTWSLCSRCANQVDPDSTGVISDDPGVVNAAILADDEG